MFVCCECCVLLGRGLCDELITRPEESYRLWCVVVCDLETSRMRRPPTALDRSVTQKKIYIYIYICVQTILCSVDYHRLTIREKIFIITAERAGTLLCKRNQLPFSRNDNLALKFHFSYIFSNRRHNCLITVAPPYKFCVAHTLFIKIMINP